MRIIISPAKKMNVNTDLFPCPGLPVFLERTEQLKAWIQTLSYEEAKALWACNDKIAAENYERFVRMDLRRQLTPALLSYEGIQYQTMAPQVFEQKQWDYVQEHLRILSGFYGILRPLDGVVPYRLEMQAKIRLPGTADKEEIRTLYAFWQDSLYRDLIEESDTILNLASKEYSKAAEPWLEPGKRFITCVFGEWKDGKVIQKGTQAKMARGEMVRFLAAEGVTEPEGAKAFTGLGYAFAEDQSDESHYIFIRR